MSKFNDKHRKVRFNLPDTNLPPVKKLKEFKTIDNRQIVNIIPKNQLNSNINLSQNKFKTISIRILPQITFLKPYKKLPNNTILPDKLYVETKPLKSSHFTIPITLALSKKSPTLIDNNKKNVEHIIILNGTPNKNKQLNDKNMLDSLKICEYFSRFRIFEDILKQKRKSLKLSEQSDHKVIYLKPLRTSVPQVNEIGGIKNFLHSNDNHSQTLADLLQRLKRMRLRENELKINNNIIVTNKKDPIESAVLFRTFKPLDVVKRFGSLKMSLERESTVSTLLRASRDADRDLLSIIFKKILIDGITPDVLNKTDKNGRTALSYICSAGMTQYLDLMLHIKGIDVNVGDNEGNTPLHYAAECGHTEIVNMMLTRCRSIQIDAKNAWGFTPLMKASVQGKTRCAKLLLFAGASPTTTDNGRKFNASEWARFLGRISCAEMLEKCAIARKLKQSVSTNNTYQISPNLNNIKRSNSLLSKMNKLLQFKSSNKESQTPPNKIVNMKNGITIKNISGYDVQTQTVKSVRSMDFEKEESVPKLIITQQSEVELMKKSEIKQIHQKYVTSSKRRIITEI